MERRDFLRILYEQHPDQSRILQGRRVIDVVDTDDSISVELHDGTVEEGDMLIGCDGVHSTVRELMWRNANASLPDFITAREKTCKPFVIWAAFSAQVTLSECSTDFHG